MHVKDKKDVHSLHLALARYEVSYAKCVRKWQSAQSIGPKELQIDRHIHATWSPGPKELHVDKHIHATWRHACYLNVSFNLPLLQDMDLFDNLIRSKSRSAILCTFFRPISEERFLSILWQDTREPNEWQTSLCSYDVLMKCVRPSQAGKRVCATATYVVRNSILFAKNYSNENDPLVVVVNSIGLWLKIFPPSRRENFCVQPHFDSIFTFFLSPSALWYRVTIS